MDNQSDQKGNDKDRKPRPGAASSSISYLAYAKSSENTNKKEKNDDSPQDIKAAAVKDPPSRLGYAETKKQAKQETTAMTTNHEQTEAIAPYESSVVYPGAVRVAGPDADLSSQQEESMEDDTFEFQEWGQQAQEQEEEQQPHEKEDEPALLHAELVSSSDDGKDVPYAEAAVPIRPWKQRLAIAILVLVVVGVTVGVAVPLTSSSSSSSRGPPATLAPSTSFPSMTPSSSPAPTAQEQITVVLGLDSNPLETGWRVDCNGLNRANFPSGVYDEFSANRNATAQFPLTVGQDCTFTLLDSAGNGLEDNGFFRLHFGLVFSTDATLLVEGDGDFGSEKQVDFTMVAPPTMSPTSSPSFFPTTTVEPSHAPSVSPTSSVEPSVFPTNAPTLPPTLAPTPLPTPAPTPVPTTLEPTPAGVVTVSPTSLGPPPPPPPPQPSPSPAAPPTQPPFAAPVLPPTQAPVLPLTLLPTLAPSPIPTRPPTRSPTPAPSPNPTLAPTPSIPADITVTIQLDNFPSETSWSMTCDGVTIRQVNAMTYGDPNQLITEVITTTVGASCTFTINDTFGDGICCRFTPEGFYRLHFGRNAPNDNNLIAEGGEFGMSNSVTFTARAAV